MKFKTWIKAVNKNIHQRQILREKMGKKEEGEGN